MLESIRQRGAALHEGGSEGVGQRCMWALGGSEGVGRQCMWVVLNT